MLKVSARFLVCMAALVAPAAVQAEPAVVSLARAYLGPQSTLDGIVSIHFIGTLDRTVSGRTEKGSMDLILVKPLRQHLVVTGPKVSRTTVLDGYDAWDWLQSNADPSKFRLTWLPAADIKTLRANTWENLYYYRIPEGGSMEAKGPATIDGVACERVDFTHGPGTVYERYFDRDTGRLVLTVRGPESIRESGELRVDGVRFAKTIVSVTKDTAGNDLVSTVNFAKIVLNEQLDPDLFVVPSIEANKAAVAPAAGK